MTNAETAHLSLAEFMTVTPTGEPGVYRGLAEMYGGMGIYGGHFLGQGLAAGFATVDEPKLAQSFHAYFLSRSDPDQPLDYHVSSLRNSTRTDVRTITARQNGTDVFHMVASFKVPEGGDEHQRPAPTVTPVDELVAAREVRGEPPFPFPLVQGGRTEMEWASRSFVEFDPDREPLLRLWMRVPHGEDLDDRGRQVVLAFLSDATLMFNSAIPHGTPMETHWLTSIDQAVWFHRVANPGQWMLYDQRSTAAADGRGMNEGEIYSADGQLIMTCAQESMLRRIEPAS